MASWLGKAMTAVLAAAIAMGVAQAQGGAVGGTSAMIDTGALKGSRDGDVVSFKGIPYAAAPVGDLRWRDPQPAKAWNGTRDATSFGADCTQGRREGKDVQGNFSENCLFVNLWRPATPETGMPVMVWIHGGGFVFGGTSVHTFDGSEYAKRGVILVSLNYRLGRLGFFAHPALTAEAPNDVQGNYGLADQIAALQWVQRNIARFGGDPKRVTIFGESAGGMSVQFLMASPLAKGLFSQAISESGLGAATRTVSLSNPTLASSEAMGVAFAKSVGISGTDAAALAKLRALPVSALNDVQGTRNYAGPVVDGKLTLGDPDAVYQAGGGARVALMIGATNMDLGGRVADTKEAAFAAFGPYAAQAKAAYDPDGSAAPAVVLREIGSDQEMAEPARFAAKIYSARGLPAYEYRFSYVPEALRATVKGAKHASELGFVFDTVGGPQHKASAGDQAMAGMMIDYWSAFGRTGNPNGAGRPEWPKYSAATDMLMEFTNSGPVAEKDPWKARLDATEAAANRDAKSGAK